MNEYFSEGKRVKDLDKLPKGAIIEEREDKETVKIYQFMGLDNGERVYEEFRDINGECDRVESELNIPNYKANPKQEELPLPLAIHPKNDISNWMQ